MNDTRSGGGPDDETRSWTSETLPMSVRKELLERELKRLGFRRGTQGAGSHDGGTAQQQQQPQGGSSHPTAGGHSD